MDRKRALEVALVALEDRIFNCYGDFDAVKALMAGTAGEKRDAWADEFSGGDGDKGKWLLELCDAYRLLKAEAAK